MSNPSRAPTAPLTKQQAELAQDNLDAYAVFPQTSRMAEVLQQGADIQYQMRTLGRLDMVPGYSVVVPREHSSEARVLQSKRPRPYSVNGAVTLRRRSALAVRARAAAYKAIPEDSPEGWPGRDVVALRCRETVRAGGGPVNTVGRLEQYYPRASQVISRPISRAEAAGALIECGLSLDRVAKEGLVPYGVGEGSRVVSINLESSNGLPVMGKFEGAAAVKVMSLYKMVSKELDEAYKQDPVEGVWNWVRSQENDPLRSWLVTLLGRCKVDSYRIGKVQDAALRFYNVFPRQLMLRMQQATQVMEEYAQGLLDAPQVCSYTGVSFTHGGADRFVDELDRRLRATGEAFVHMGDDSMVAVRLSNGELMLFDLDCSSFDLTQHKDTTEAVHQVLRDELGKVDPVAAQLWYALMRTRVVLTMGSVTMRWFHGGPSGAPLQSKVNDMLMHVLIRRVLAAVPPASRTRSAMADAVEQQGRRMGFVVRMENARAHNVQTVREWLARTPFLFVGYYLYNARGRVQVFSDLPRTMGQMVYPSLEHMSKEELDELEPVRLGSLILSMGEPPPHLERMMELLTGYCLGLLDRAIASGRVVDAALARWAVETSGGDLDLSLVGLARAIRRGPGAIWGGNELPSTSTLIPLVAPGAMISPFARAWLEARRAVLKPARERGSEFDAVQHAPTRMNAGRPPPTTFWAPDRLPMPRGAERDFVQGERRRGRKKGAKRTGVWSDSDQEDESDGESVWSWT